MKFTLNSFGMAFLLVTCALLAITSIVLLTALWGNWFMFFLMCGFCLALLYTLCWGFDKVEKVSNTQGRLRKLGLRF